MLTLAVPDGAAVNTRRDAILSAALQHFSRYGYRRTAMANIAQAAGISRAALYRHFESKEDIFRALAQRLHEQALAAAQRAARTDRPITLRLERVLEATLATFFEIVHGAAHARELLDENNRICGDIATAFRKKHAAVLRAVVTAAAKQNELDLAVAGLSANAATERLLTCAKRLEASPALPPARLRRGLHAQVEVIVAGWTKGRRASAGSHGSRA